MYRLLLEAQDATGLETEYEDYSDATDFKFACSALYHALPPKMKVHYHYEDVIDNTEKVEDCAYDEVVDDVMAYGK
mgnify:FL=1